MEEYSVENLEEQVRVMLDSGMRNRFLRKSALVQYRCKRGCLLGAVVAVKGQMFWAAWQHYGVDVVEVPVIDIIEILEGNSEVITRTPPEVVAEIRLLLKHIPLSDLLGGLGGDDLAIYPTSLREQISMGMDRHKLDGGILNVEPWGKPLDDTQTHRECQRANCRHTDLSLRDWDIWQDIKRLGRGKNKTVRVATTDNSGVD